ncbi:MAG: hypothetical protein AAF772_18950 [Acidobacteriota bacterium]
MTTYRHSQTGTLLLVTSLLGLIPLVLVLAFYGQLFGPMLFAVGMILIVLMIFHELTIEVRRNAIVASFGLGLIRRTVPLTQIREVRRVRNSWLHGWGIRWIPHGWMFNVSGLDAVELTLESGRVFRIGTDQPDEAVRAIRDALTQIGGA